MATRKIDATELRRLKAAGLTTATIAGALGVTTRTVERQWAELRRQGAEAPRKPTDLRQRVLDSLTSAMVEGSVPAAREILNELNREAAIAEYEDRTAATARAWARAAGARLGAWVRPRLDDDPELRDLWKRCGGTLVHDRDREALITLLLERGAEACLAI
jgi:hypothetical protein